MGALKGVGGMEFKVLDSFNKTMLTKLEATHQLEIIAYKDLKIKVL